MCTKMLNISAIREAQIKTTRVIALQHRAATGDATWRSCPGKHRAALRPSSSTPRNVSKRNENTHSPKWVAPVFRAALCGNSQKAETAQTSTDRRGDLFKCGPSYEGISFSHNKARSADKRHATPRMDLETMLH